MPQYFDDVNECVEAAIRTVGRHIVLGLPLAIGKPAAIANEFFRRALREPTLELTILTALSLRRPVPGSELERRFAGPLVERIFGDYQDLEYALAERAGRLPPNVRVIEFFFEPGASLNVAHAQQNFLATNYTHAARDIAARGVNVLAQMVARRSIGGETRFSLGSNPDVTLDLMPHVAAARAAGRPVVLMAHVHSQMPFTFGHADVEPGLFDLVLEEPRYDHALFCPPNPALASVDHAIGLHASALVRDGGTLQIGIGELGDSICYALLLRHQQNQAWRQALHDVGTERTAAAVDRHGGREPFRTGLFGSTEMFVDQMLDLYRAGVLRRRVYDSLPLSRLIASGNIGDRFDERILEDLPHVGVGPRLTAEDFLELRRHGVFRQDCRWDDGRIRTPDGRRISADLGDREARAALAAECLGRELRNGRVMHAGFLLGPRGFYAALRELPDDDLRQFDMRGVGYINQLYGPDAELRVLQRTAARFVNTTMMVTLLGAAISDALDDGRVVSGVGGQYNFVAMAHALPDACSILCARATRTKGGRTSSNIVWSYGHVTIPRHLRDIVVTEYGIADLRGRTDAECIAALLNVADSRFQDQLLAQARAAGKIAADYRIPEAFRRNTPRELERAFEAHRRAGLFSEYPFGTDLTAEEVVLSHALRHLRDATATRGGKLRTLLAAVLRPPQEYHAGPLRRMGLAEPANRHEWLLQRLVAQGLRGSGH
ncbi:MAG: acetyl-CoA hydrolase/transferase C-terminal domain-containing protein [Steroidobacteraceae bacterium]